MSFFASVWAVLRHVVRRHWRLLLALGFGFVLPWLLVLRMAREVWEQEGFWGDRAVLEWLHAHATPAQDALALWLAQAGGFTVMPIVAGLVGLGLLLARQRRAALFFGLAVGGSGVLNLIAKAILGRARPDLWPSLTPLTSYSFPSGHAMAAATLALAVSFLLWHTWARWLAIVLGVVWALLMGWSRMYLGVHFPSDVLAGWLGAAGWVSGVHLLHDRYFHEVRQLWNKVQLYWDGRPAAALARPESEKPAESLTQS